MKQLEGSEFIAEIVKMQPSPVEKPQKPDKIDVVTPLKAGTESLLNASTNWCEYKRALSSVSKEYGLVKKKQESPRWGS